MILWLDHKIFGNGYGLKSPYFDAKFYWLSGELYHWSGGFGAQLASIQWRHPKAGERRKLLGREFRALHSERRFMWLGRIVPLPICRVEVAWSLSGVDELPPGVDEPNIILRQLQKDLDKL